MTRLMLPPLALCLLAGCAALNPLGPLEQRLVYQPSPLDVVPPEVDFESVEISVPGGSEIHGVLLEHAQATGVLLYCHGNAGNIVHRLPRLRQLRSEHRLTVLGFDYRGYGKSAGRPTESGLYDDARAARAWLAARTGQSEDQIIVMGRSLGGGVAVELAARDGARGLILENTFTSIPDVGKSMMSWLPTSVVSQRFDSVGKITDYRGPLLQTHGVRDQVVPYRLGHALHQQANQPKVFVQANGGHNDAPSAEYAEQLGRFLAALP